MNGQHHNPMDSAWAGPKVSKKQPIANTKDWYWEIFDHDGDFDGYLHVVCTVDGSELKIKLTDIQKDYQNGFIY